MICHVIAKQLLFKREVDLTLVKKWYERSYNSRLAGITYAVGRISIGYLQSALKLLKRPVPVVSLVKQK